jgi:hypothetical protein
MQAKELVTILEENNPDYGRQTLLNEINYIQRLIFGSANKLNLATDPTTNKDPKITPTDAITTIADAQRIDRVYKENFNLPHRVRIQGNVIHFDPNDLGQEYYVRYYERLPELTSELMELSVPEEYIDVLEDGVELRLSSKEHGSKEEFRYWKLRDLPKLQRKLNNDYRWGKPDGTQTIPTDYGTLRRAGYYSKARGI